MNYELAKKLKNAGFLQRVNPDVMTQGYYLNKQGERLYSPDEESVYVPTLEELIDACGERFVALRKPIDPIPGKWIANADASREGGYSIGNWGDNPLEAVANLYIALHGKK